MEPLPRIGVAVIITDDDGGVLLGQRKNSHGSGSWGFVGGHLEFGETPEQCARREALEEVGIDLGIIIAGPYTNDIFEEEAKHYVTLFMVTRYNEQPIQLLEPEKCEGWRWFAWDELPSDLFLPIVHLQDTGFNPAQFLKHNEGTCTELLTSCR